MNYWIPKTLEMLWQKNEISTGGVRGRMLFQSGLWCDLRSLRVSERLDRSSIQDIDDYHFEMSLKLSTHAYVMMSLLSLKFSTSVALVGHVKTLTCSVVIAIISPLKGYLFRPSRLLCSGHVGLSSIPMCVLVVCLLSWCVESIFVCLHSPDFSHQFLN